MGINAQTSVPKFTAGDTLTAANTNLLSNGIPVFGGTALRDAAFGGSNEKVLAEGQYAYLEDTNTTQFYDGAAWQPVGVAPGLVLVKTQTIGSSVGTVTVSDCFSATYEAYKIVISGGVGSDANNSFSMKLGGSNTGYYYNMLYTQYNNTLQADSGSNATAWYNFGSIDTTALSMVVELNNPFLAKNTTFSTAVTRTGVAGASQGLHTVATSYTGFNLTPDIGTLTGGTIRVYGYALS